MPNANLLVASLSSVDNAVLRALLKPAYLTAQQVLFEGGDTIEAVYFPTDAIISMVVGLSTGQMVETAMVGRDGIVGASAALDGKYAANRAVVQFPGAAFVCEAQALKRAVLQSATLQSVLIRHEQTLLMQTQQSVACIAAHHIEARLSRWLLRARELSGSDSLPFTQEFLAEMLGVQRSSVSVVAHTLQQAGLIKYSRGRIQILNLDGLQETACECYAIVANNYRRLLGPH